MFAILARRIFDYTGTSHKQPGGEFPFTEELYQKYKALLFQKASQFTNDPYAKEDIVQNAVLRLLRREERLRTLEPAALTTYLTLTVRSAALEYFRVERRDSLDALPLPSEEDEEYIPLYSTETPLTLEEQMLLGHRNEEVRTAIERLSERDRLALLGKYFLELDNQELAELLDVTPGALRTLLCRARGRVLNELRKEGILHE